MHVATVLHQLPELTPSFSPPLAMYQPNPDLWQTIAGVLSEPFTFSLILAALTTTVGSYIFFRVITRKCHEVTQLAESYPKNVYYAGRQYHNVRGADAYLFDRQTHVQMLEARACALYAPLLSFVPLAMAGAWLYVLLVDPLHDCDMVPELTVCIIVTLCYLIQRALFDNGLDRYFETVPMFQDGFGMQDGVRSKKAELEASSGLTYVYLRVLLAIAPLSAPGKHTPGWITPERHPLLSRQNSSGGRRGRRSAFPGVKFQSLWPARYAHISVM